MSAIQVLLACPSVAAQLNFEGQTRRGKTIEVAHKVEALEDTYNHIASVLPDIVLIDADELPGDAFQLTRKITLELPTTAVIILSANEEPENLRRAMLAGGEEYIIKPTDSVAVATAIFDVDEVRTEKLAARAGTGMTTPSTEGHVVGVISGKGGLGKTTIATNLAVALASHSERRVAIVSLDVGDASVLLNLSPQHTLTELNQVYHEIDLELVQGYGLRHKSGVTLFASNVLLALETGQSLTAECASAILGLLRQAYDYVFVDMPLVERTEECALLSDLDDIILLTSSWDLLVLRNTKLLLDRLPADCNGKTRIVLNRADKNDMIQESQVEKTLGKPITATIRNDSRIAPAAINVGVPFVTSHPGSLISQDLHDLLRKVTDAVIAEPKEQRRKFALFG